MTCTKYAMRRSELTEKNDYRWSDKTFGDDVIVWLNTMKINASWSKDRDAYFDRPDHPNVIGQRIPRFGDWLKKGDAIRAPEICLTDAGEVFFTNGRHRFFWMKSHGVKRMPFAVPSNQVEEFKRRFS